MHTPDGEETSLVQRADKQQQAAQTTREKSHHLTKVLDFLGIFTLADSPLVTTWDYQTGAAVVALAPSDVIILT